MAHVFSIRHILIMALLCCVATFFGYSILKNITIQEKGLSTQNFFNAKPTDNHASYIYAPGMMGTEILMGRYCPNYVASTGEKISWKSGGHVIGHPHTGVIFAEIDLRKPNDFTLNPLRAIINNLRSYAIYSKNVSRCLGFYR